MEAFFHTIASIYLVVLSFVNNLCQWLEAYEENTEGNDLNNTAAFLPVSPVGQKRSLLWLIDPFF